MPCRGSEAGLGSRGRGSWAPGSGRAVGRGAPRAGFAPVCAARGRCVPGRPSLRGQTRLEPSLGAGARREDTPRPGGPGTQGLRWRPQPSPRGLRGSWLACLTFFFFFKWPDRLKPGARPSRRFLCLASGRVLPVVQLAIGRSPSNFCLLPGAAAEPTRQAN